MQRWKRYQVLSSLLAFFLVTELCLRIFWGLGSPVLLQADPDTGYRYQPNQSVVRFGKRITYNQYSQRSAPISPDKPARTLRILMVGDSILNGGNPTDQSQTVTEFLRADLEKAGYRAEVLNASAGSWGIGNHQGYLRKFGLFQSDAVILELATHDLVQPTSTSSKIGKDPNFPDRRPILAWQELIGRYLWPWTLRHLQLQLPTSEIPVTIDPAQEFRQNRQLLAANIGLIQDRQIPVFVLFVPELRNVIPPYPKPLYKPQFLALLQSLAVPVIDAQTAWSQIAPSQLQAYYRDNWHPNETGNRAIATLVFNHLCLQKQLSACSRQHS